ncbi:Crp/Fnr family transcriptional regulator [Leeuwenhoekiella parthenopeia]|uniref:Crp/Fnr family transcriptional regulator n=1 Tax=Leeuwenhoekiella parthenopeia TaxID=2890320 RepID=A0ABS8GX27_9FLAO|nr:Crp/Fnr family transcriptional regulator [Leeuwenhoekiella parthenopeia]MCC4214566.1 Crp/Fnr family transcriptional regulator [Leeuwenhoekiella parthenopeia]
MYSALRSHIEAIVSLTDSEFEEFVSILSLEKFKKDEFIIRQGDAVTKEYYVLEGCAQAYYASETGDRSVLQFAIEDWWISDFSAFYNNTPAVLNVRCIEDTVVLGLHRQHLEEFYERVPKFERFFRIKVTKAFLSLKNRIQSGLDKNSKERYLDFCQTYSNIERRVPNYQIASYLGIQPQSLSRIRKEIQTSGPDIST